MKALTKSGLFDFHDFAVSKGLMKANTGNARKQAAAQILEDFGADDDLTNVDVPSEVLKYNNRHPGKLSPSSLNAYQGRVILAISEFKKYLDNPMSYKGVSGKATTTATNGKSTRTRVALVEPQSPTPKHPTSAVTDTSLMMPFPLRPTFLAQLIIPRDLSKDEATRLCAFIQALAVEPTVVQP